MAVERTALVVLFLVDGLRTTLVVEVAVVFVASNLLYMIVLALIRLQLILPSLSIRFFLLIIQFLLFFLRLYNKEIKFFYKNILKTTFYLVGSSSKDA